jgi:hypothetical protein
MCASNVRPLRLGLVRVKASWNLGAATVILGLVSAYCAWEPRTVFIMERRDLLVLGCCALILQLKRRVVQSTASTTFTDHLIVYSSKFGSVVCPLLSLHTTEFYYVDSL